MWKIFALILGLALSVTGEAPLQSNYISYPPNTNQNLQQGYNYEAPQVEVNAAKQNQPSLRFTQSTAALQPQRSASGYNYDAPSQNYQAVQQYQQPLQQNRQPVQQYIQPLQQYQQPLQQYQQPIQQYQQPIQQYQQPIQPQQQNLNQEPKSLYQQPIAQLRTYSAPKPTQQSFVAAPQPQPTHNDNGYHYDIPQQSFNSPPQNSILSLQSTNSLSGDAEVFEPIVQQKQVSPLTLERYQQPINSQNYKLSLQSGNALDIDLMNQVANLLQEHENSYARSSYQKIAGVTLDQPSQSIEVSSFVQNTPLSNQLGYSNEAQTSGAQSPLGLQVSTGYNYPQQSGIHSTQDNHFVLPEIVANRQAQTTTSNQRLTQSYNYPQPARINTIESQYGLPQVVANQQVSNAPIAAPKIYSNQNQYSGYNYPQPSENNQLSLPEVITNRHAQSSSIGIQAQSRSYQYSQPSIMSASQYGLPEVVANRQVQRTSAEVASAPSVQEPSSGYNYPQSVNSNSNVNAEQSGLLENAKQVSATSALSSTSSASTQTHNDVSPYSFVPRENQPVSSYGVPN